MIRRFITILTGIVICAGSASFSSAATVNVTIDFSIKMQKFNGWGTSLCWWAVRVGNWPEAKLRNLAALITDPDTGLGLSIFRYNIGGGENPSHTHMRAGGNVPGYKASETAAYDWSADPNQRAVLKNLIASCPGAIVEGFSNSPPHWMTKSGCASGAADGTNNLKDDYYDDFAAYLVEVAKHFREEWGTTFATLEPLNESEADWWKSNGSQEGCHFDRGSQEKIIKEVYNALKTAGLEKTIRVSADDANSIDACLANLNAWSSTTLSCIGQINTHSYNGSKRAALRTRADALKLPLFQSESGPLSWSGNSVYDAALFMSRRIISDLYEMKVEAWTDWQLMDESTTWQLISTTWSGGMFSPATNFFARASFSRFIRPGWSIVTTGNSDVAAAASPASDSFGIVILNETATDKQYSFSFKNSDTAIRAVELYRTSPGEQCTLVKSGIFDGNTLAVTVPARSLASLRARRPGGTFTSTPPNGSPRNAVSVRLNRAGKIIDISFTDPARRTMTVYAVNGTASATIKLSAAPCCSADLSSLPAGLYVFSLTEENGATERFRMILSW